MKHEPDLIDREIGRRLRLARITANIRQRQAAKLVGVTGQQIRKIIAPMAQRITLALRSV